MNVLVIYEKDFRYNEEDVIGVADSVEAAEKLIKEWCGGYKEIATLQTNLFYKYTKIILEKQQIFTLFLQLLDIYII